jgi:hypothetical protein
MTKNAFKKIAWMIYGVDARYSGKEKIMYLRGGDATYLVALMKDQYTEFSLKIHTE